jgi:hypothetical protein
MDAAREDCSALGFEVTKYGSTESAAMKRLIIHGDPGVRKDAVIEVDGEEYTVFGVARQGEWHGPDRVQLWCTVGGEDERETYERREFITMHLDTESVEAEAVDVVQKAPA